MSSATASSARPRRTRRGARARGSDRSWGARRPDVLRRVHLGFGGPCRMVAGSMGAAAEEALRARPAWASRARWKTALGALALSVAALIPFWSLYAAHFLGSRPGWTPTGFIQYDQLYYLANAREMVREGSWVFYRNPFDHDPAARPI